MRSARAQLARGTPYVPRTRPNRSRTDSELRPDASRTERPVDMLFLQSFAVSYQALPNVRSSPVYNFQTSYAGSIPVARSIPAPATEAD